MYRAHPTAETLKKYGEQVEATAEFMADFVTRTVSNVQHGTTFHALLELFDLKGSTAMQECMTKDISYNQPKALPYPTENPWA